MGTKHQFVTDFDADKPTKKLSHMPEFCSDPGRLECICQAIFDLYWYSVLCKYKNSKIPFEVVSDISVHNN